MIIIISKILKYLKSWKSTKILKCLNFVRSFAPNISWWKGCLRGSYGRESCEVCCKVILDLWMCRFPYENCEFDIFQNNYHEKYENQDINSPGDRFRRNFVRTSITSFQAYLVQWWSKSDRQIFHTFDMKIFDNCIFKIIVIRSITPDFISADESDPLRFVLLSWTAMQR